MWSRAAKLDQTPGEILTTACYNFSEYLGARLFPNAIDRPERYLYRDFDKAAQLRAQYLKEGMSSSRIDKTLLSDALAKISQHPYKYLLYTPVEVIKMTAFTYLPLLNEAAIKNSPAISILKSAMRMLAYPLLLLAVIGIARNLATWQSWLIIFTVILYFNAIYSLMDAFGRYGIPLIPFYCIFAAAAFNSNLRISA